MSATVIETSVGEVAHLIAIEATRPSGATVKPILAAFDDHEHADDALRWAAELARLEGTPLHVVNVFEPTYSEISPDWMEELLERRREKVNGVLAEIDAADAEVVVLHGSDPMSEIAAYVETHDAQMVVIGAHSAGGPGGLGASGPAHHLVQHSRIPVAVVRPDYRPLDGGIIAIGVDGSTANSVALERGEAWAKAVGGTVHAVFAYDPMDDTFGRDDGWHRHSDEVRSEVAKVTSVDAKLYMAAGHPADVLIEHAQRERAAAIVLGTRGHGGFAGLRVGRVPVQAIAHATCPVIVVPH